MAKVTLQPNGIKISKSAGFNPSPKRRGRISGWSLASARRNDDFLRSVDPVGLSGEGVSFSLTVKDLPENHAEWERVRRAFLKRLERMGLVRLHWLTEFQRRGVPHIHGIAYFADGAKDLQIAIVYHWLQVTRHLSSRSNGQHTAVINDVGGWLFYLGKHGSRGVYHYQRSIVPKAWEKTGRLWGHTGDWPTLNNERFIEADAYYNLRRNLTRYLIADARSQLKNNRFPDKAASLKSRVKFLKGRRNIGAQALSSVRGFSDWIDDAVYQRIFDFTCPDSRPYDDRPVGVCPTCEGKIYRLTSIVKVRRDYEDEPIEDCISDGRTVRMCAACRIKGSTLTQRALYSAFRRYDDHNPTD